jgi:hypothetical protein
MVPVSSAVGPTVTIGSTMSARDARDMDPVVVSEAYAAARELLQQAETDAASIRADADRYLRQREQEAEMVVAKARRLLSMAEERGTTMSTPTPTPTPAPAPVRVVLDVDAPAPAWDLDPDAVPATNGAQGGAATVLNDAQPAQAAEPARSGLDSIVASSVSRAIHRALTTTDD